MKVIFVDPKGERRTVEAQVGASLMEAARDNGVPGIDADCGGMCACATCHVFVSPDWISKVGPPREQEAELLSLAPDPTEYSRLACQISLSEDLEGLTVTTPIFQY